MTSLIYTDTNLLKPLRLGRLRIVKSGIPHTVGGTLFLPVLKDKDKDEAVSATKAPKQKEKVSV